MIDKQLLTQAESLVAKAEKIRVKLRGEIIPDMFTRGSAAQICTKRALDAVETLKHELGGLVSAIEQEDV